MPHESCKELFFNSLTERIFHPTIRSNDIVLQLRNIFFTRSSDDITLTIKYDSRSRRYLYEKVSLEVSYEELMEVITPNQLFTMNFFYAGASFKEFNLDFDLAWRNLAPKVESAYTLLKEVLSEAPITEDEMLRVEFYQRTTTGIMPITEKTYTSLSTRFSLSEFDIVPDPENVKDEDLETKVLSMIFWMVMEPNIVPVVKLPNGDIFLIMDIHEIHDENRFLDTLTGKYTPPSGFEQFFGIFSRSDLMNFANFHNHEQSDQHSDMISYVMAKFIKHYWIFLEGDKDSKLFDLR